VSGLPTGIQLCLGRPEEFRALVLWSPLAAMGSVIAVGVMCGAIIAHVP